jgi:acyl-CoA thioesterase
MNDTIRHAIFDAFRNEPFAQKLKLELVDLQEGYSRVAMTITPELDNIFGMAHGGALFALMDAAFETACNSHGTVAVALNVNVTYVASPAPGSRITAEAREFSRTRKTANYHITVTDDQQQLLASCQALAYRKGTPLPFLEEPRPSPIMLA